MRLVTAGVRMAPERAAFDADTRPRRDVSGPEFGQASRSFWVYGDGLGALGAVSAGGDSFLVRSRQKMWRSPAGVAGFAAT